MSINDFKSESAMVLHSQRTPFNPKPNEDFASARRLLHIGHKNAKTTGSDASQWAGGTPSMTDHLYFYHQGTVDDRVSVEQEIQERSQTLAGQTARAERGA